MNNKQMKKATVDAINVMIRHADKGPSGFWVEDHEGCGNPAVFPEFEEGLKRGRLVQKEHYFCPWNTAIMYGDGHGNIITGCYHSCSIDKARYLSAQELKEILARFKTRMENGDYDCVEHLSPLLTKDESRHIEDRILAEQHERERCARQKRQERLEKAVSKVRTMFLTQRRELNVEIFIVGEFLCSSNITLGSWVEKNYPTFV